MTGQGESSTSGTATTNSSGIFGHIPNFNHENSNWNIFHKQLEQFFIMNDIKPEQKIKRRAILLNAVHAETFQLLINLCHPDSPDTVEYATLITTLDKHFKPTHSEFAERRKFYDATKNSQETISEWAARVRALSTKCEFLDSLDMVLRDRFIMGLGMGPVKDKLFLENVNKLSFDEAVRIANTIDCISHQYDEGSGSAGVYRISRRQEQRSAPNKAMKRTKRRGSSGMARGSSEERCCVCGYTNHTEDECRFKDYRCRKCRSKGHLMKMCKIKGQPTQNYISFEDDDSNYLSMFYFRTNAESQPIRAEVSLDGVVIEMEIDSGSPISAISDQLYQKHFLKYPLEETKTNLVGYNGNVMKIKGIFRVKVSFRDLSAPLDIFVIDSGGPPLLGRNWMFAFNLGIKECNHLSTSGSQELSRMLEKYNDVFKKELGKFNKSEVKLKLKSKVEPKFCKPRPVPLAIKPKVEEEIDKLLRLGVLEQVDYSSWGTPIVPILKKNGEIRICGDYKVTVNPQLVVEQYPLPRIEELFAKLHGGKEFSKIDLSMAYQQLVLDSESREYTTISTTKGLFRYTRLVFGIASAPAIFQRTMDSLFAGFPGVVVFMDDILVTAPDRTEHVKRLEAVLGRLQKSGLRVQKEKCEFLRQSVTFLGHILDKNGLHMCPSKVSAMKNAEPPKDVKELQAFLGLINYYRKFIPNMSAISTPLYALLAKDVEFQWGKNQQLAFEELKQALTSKTVLAHFDPAVPVKLTVDASSIGISAILSHVYSSNVARPIAFASRTLSQSEKNYSQISKEALAIVYGVRKFHQYLYGRKFLLETDHQPLVAIFGSKKGIPLLAANRLQRYALILSGYTFEIKYVNTKLNIADFLSRLPQPVSELDEKIDVESQVFVHYILDSEKLPITFEEVKRVTAEDAMLKQIAEFTNKGWPKQVSMDLNPYRLRQESLSVESGCLFWGHRLVIPKLLRSAVLGEIHKTHQGICKMKGVARSYFWWPKLDKDLEDMAKSCENCLQYRSNPPKSELITWKWPSEPWSRVHLDFMGPIFGKYFLILVDAHSKWPECIDMNQSITASQTIKALRAIFARFGLPRQIASDNGPSFTSQEFQKFLSNNGIEHLTSPVGHPSTNGQAENGVKLVKNGLKKALYGIKIANLDLHLNAYLLDYRNSIHSTTGEAPAKLMLGRYLRNRLDLLNPRRDSGGSGTKKTVQENVLKHQQKQKEAYKGRANKMFAVNDVVMAKDYSAPGKVSWTKGIIAKKLGRQIYMVSVAGTSKIWKRHANQLIHAAGVEKSSEQYVPYTLQTPQLTADNTQNIPSAIIPNQNEQQVILNEPRYNLRKRCNPGVCKITE